MERGIEDDETDRRREAAMSAAASLRPNFKPKGGLTEAQLSKFQELHRRRLQIKAKSKVQKRDKGFGDGKGKSHKKPMEGLDLKDQEQSETSGDSSSHSISEKKPVDFSTMEERQHNHDAAANMTARKRQKLYWGLDTKERWERKSNM